jgi:hypothetical protein
VTSDVQREIANLPTEIAPIPKKTVAPPREAQVSQPAPAPVPVKQRKLFVPKTDPLDGMIAHLTKECGGNVHDHNVVKVTCFQPSGAAKRWQSGAHSDNPPKHAVDLLAPSMFQSAPFNGEKYDQHFANVRGSWLCYDFNGRRIIPTHYTIRSFRPGAGSAHRKSWLLEVSTDGNIWTEVDERGENSELNGSLIARTFAVKKSEECRYIRLVNVGRNHEGDEALCLSAWEMLGSLIE